LGGGASTQAPVTGRRRYGPPARAAGRARRRRVRQRDHRA